MKFASSTIAGANTRRFHGLPVAATKPPLGRVVMLSMLEETLMVDGQRYYLSVDEYPGAVHPRGHELPREFRLDPFPVACFGGWRRYDREACFPGAWREHHGGGVRVDRRCGERVPARVAATNRLSQRPFDGARQRSRSTGTEMRTTGLVRLAPYGGVPPMYPAHNAVAVDASGAWYRNLEYARERDRGLSFQEDLLQPSAAL